MEFATITAVNFRIFSSPQKEPLDTLAITPHPFPGLTVLTAQC